MGQRSFRSMVEVTLSILLTDLWYVTMHEQACVHSNDVKSLT